MLRRLIVVCVAAGFVGWFAARWAQAQTGVLPGMSSEPAASDPGPPDARLQEMLTSPRSTMRNFLELVKANDRTSAANCLDLSQLTRDTAAATGPDLVFYLKETLDRMGYIESEKIPSESDYEGDFVVEAAFRDPLTGADLNDAQRIVISRGADNLWRFSSDTISQIRTIHERWKDREVVEGVDRGELSQPFSEQLKDRFPTRLHGTTFLLPDYQWICLVMLVFFGFLVDLVVRFVLRFLCRAWFRFVKAEDKYRQQRQLWRPVGLLAQALVWYWGTRAIGLPDWALAILLTGLKLFAVVAGVWTAFLAINLLSTYVASKASKTGTKFDDLLVPLISKSFKAIVVVIGILTSAEAFSLPIAGLLTSLGLVGAALALASKDAVSNFFGSVTVLVDRPFEIGDWVVTNGVEGTVEAVGFRSTRIRTFYNSQITVPNSLLTTAIVDNMGRRRYRRIKTMLSLQYDTRPEQVDAFCEGVRELIRRHPYTRKDYFHVYLNALDESSINVLLYCFVETSDWAVELREKHRLFVDIMKLAENLGVQFAFPTRTLHMFNEQLPDGELPLDLSVPTKAGRRQAAEIAGPLLTGDRRPGPVKFSAPVESDEPDESPDDGEAGSQ